jgi:hypothetical protein
MRQLLVSFVVTVAFLAAAGLSSQGNDISFPSLAYAAGTCSLAPLVCANDSSPGCEIICGGEQQAVCVEGSCTAAGNIQNANRCSCK